jgi:NAD(P)-dependent dehydrogenase (short-subunit alcohol dehydrogenase family)
MQEQQSAGRRTAFVTGASQGIGAAIAVGLARNGFDVAVSSRLVEKLSDVAQEIASTGARALTVALDVRSQSSIEQAMASVIAAFGHLDVLVNNAAVTLRKSALDVTRDEWEAVMGTNNSGTFFMSQQMGRHLIGRQQPGCIVSVASTHGLVALDGRSTYGISKAAIMHMTRVLAIEWAKHGVRVNAVAPGTVITPARAALPQEPGHREKMRNRIPLRRECTAEEVAGAVCYLTSPQAAIVTGQTLILDGGLTAY